MPSLCFVCLNLMLDICNCNFSPFLACRIQLVSEPDAISLRDVIRGTSSYTHVQGTKEPTSRDSRPLFKSVSDLAYRP